jgi:hypothetical protein
MTKSIEHSDRPIDQRPRPDRTSPLLTNTFYKDNDVTQFLVTIRRPSHNDVGLIRKAIIETSNAYHIDVAMAGHTLVNPDHPFNKKRG